MWLQMNQASFKCIKIPAPFTFSNRNDFGKITYIALALGWELDGENKPAVLSELLNAYVNPDFTLEVPLWKPKGDYIKMIM